MSDIGITIRNYRLLRKMSQRQLADKLGKTSAVISNWEKDINSPDLDSIEKLCHILECTPNELLGWSESEEFKQFMQENERAKAEIEKLLKARALLDKQIATYKEQFDLSVYLKGSANGPTFVIEPKKDS